MHDCTLREGEQACGVSFRIEDKIRLIMELDDLGVDIVECGWPSANPKDSLVIRRAREYSPKCRLAAFTSTRRKDRKVEDDPIIVETLKAEPDVVVIFGKTWSLHVREVLKTDGETNLRMIEDSILFFKDHGIDVIFDAEHFFDGYKDDREYALRVVRLVDELKVRTLVLCDTNGGCLPHEVHDIVRDVVSQVRNAKVGVHLHNDSGCAVASSIMAVLAGASHVQVTVNGIGERCGNADLCQVVPNLMLKLGVKVLRGDVEKLRKLTYLSRLVYELTGIPRNPYQPYVGENAFSHKAGVHVDAIMKCPRAYEHVDPELVGNRRRIVVSELSGRAAVLSKIQEVLGIQLSKSDPRVVRTLEELKRLEENGLNFDQATATAVLILLRNLGVYKEFFRVLEWKVMCERAQEPRAWSWIKIAAQNRTIIEAGEGVGPVHAIDTALRNALTKLYPEVSNVELVDYKVVLLGVPKHTASIVRVDITFRDRESEEYWTTTHASKNIVDASTIAIADGLDYYLQLRYLKDAIRVVKSIMS
ncbi:MAG: citramalate synthase [Crenarchaeota archaeon]|nr:citramalate synthase [Thermoproteota archaeon]